VLVTHAHPDHVDLQRLPQLLEANDGAVLHTEPELAAQLRDLGAHPLHPGEHLSVAGVDVEAVGGQHALIHPDVPRIGNIGLVVRAAGEPVLFHPGDSYAALPEGVDVLALPLNAPWAAGRETTDFLRALAPATAVPVHDALLSAAGRSVYLGNLGRLRPEGTTVHDTGGRGVLEV
jgi:L-ascorbate metabolism protein UlaG (beta-lactamase superfamily)